MLISFFDSERDNNPRQPDLTWDELGTLLADVRRTDCEPCPASACEAKLGKAWSPATFNGTRAKANVTQVSALVVDLDHLTDAEIGQFAPRLGDLRCFIHSSHSDREGDRCLRVVVDISRPINAAEWPKFWTAAMESLGLPADPQTCDASRLYFLPSRPKGAEFLFHRIDGQKLDVDRTLSEAPQATETLTPAATAPEPSRGQLGELVARVEGLPPDRQAAAALLARHWPTRGRHFASLSLAGALARAGWDSDAIADFLTALCSAVNGDDGEPEKRYAQAVSSVAKVAAGEDVRGWPSLMKDHGIPQASIVKACEWLDVNFQPMHEPLNLDAILKPQESVPIDPDGLAILVSEAASIETVPSRCYPTGFNDLDRLLGGGVWTRRLHVVCGAPADGKSGFVLDLAKRSPIPAIVVSTELESDEIAARAAAPEVGKPWRALLTKSDEKTAALQDVEVYVIGVERLPRDPGEALTAIAREHARLTAELGTPPLLIVDYLQLLCRGVDDRAMRGKVGELTLFFRALSQTNDCPVVVVSTVSRSYYGKAKAEQMRMQDNAEAYLAAAKESGDVDYDAAFLLFLDVDPAVDGVDHRLARIAVAKSRLGQAGFAGARFYGAIGKWEPDRSATTALAPEGRQKLRQEKQDAEDRAAVMRAFQRFPEGAKKTVLKAAAGGNGQRIGRAIDRMIGDGEIEELGKLLRLSKKAGTKPGAGS